MRLRTTAEQAAGVVVTMFLIVFVAAKNVLDEFHRGKALSLFKPQTSHCSSGR